MRCLSCKYDLRNLTEHRCPECGRAHDPADPATFDSGIPNDPRRRRIRLFCIAFCVISLHIAFAELLLTIADPWYVSPVGSNVLLAESLVVSTAVLLLANKIDRVPGRRPIWMSIGLAIMICFALVVAAWGFIATAYD